MHSKARSVFAIFYLWTFSVFASSSSTNIEKPIVVVIPSYNNRQWVHQNVMSVLSQDYSNYRVIYIDDASLDGTADEVEGLIRDKSERPPFTLIRNSSRKGGLSNLYHTVSGCADEEIVLILDGDDWFANNWVLKIINEAYSTQDVWLTHGTMIEYPRYSLGWSIPIPEKIVTKNAFRTYRCPSHLKTFYAWLFKKIDVEDLKYQGKFFPMTGDQAIMFPMIEMAGDRHAFISEIIYVYNMSNPINDNKVDAKLQNDLEMVIRSKTPYSRLP